jgi:uncharacterized membrane protein (DUF485 family)
MALTYDALSSSPEYQALIHKRHRIIWPLAVITIAAYVGFILSVAFEPAALGKTLEGTKISIGILSGLLLIVFNFIITLVYVYRANREIQPLLDRVHALAQEK